MPEWIQWSRRHAGILGVLALGLALRAAWAMETTDLPRGLHDPYLYLLRGLQIATGQGYTHADGTPTAYYPVGYPLVLGGLFWLVGVLSGRSVPSWEDINVAARARSGEHTAMLYDLVQAASALNVVLDLVSIGLVYLLGRRLAGARTGLLASLGVALFPNLIFHTSVLLGEPLFICTVLLALSTLLLARGSPGLPSRPRQLLFGVLLGCSALVRPPSLLCVPLVPWMWRRAGIEARACWRAVAVVALGLALPLLPWTLRNLVVMPAPVLISTNLGDNLCIGHHPDAPGHYVTRPECEEDPSYMGLPATEFEVARNRHNIRQALRFAFTHPLEEVRITGRRLLELFEHDHSGLIAVESFDKNRFLPGGLRGALQTIAYVYFLTVLGLGALGAVGFARRSPAAALIVGVALVLMWMPLAFFGNPRFHVPAMPLWTLPAAWLCAGSWMRRAPTVSRDGF